MQFYAARLASFQQPHQIAKRRASSQKKGKQSVEWPHESPSDVELARAGFFYRPGQDSADNVQCFLCGVKLDGWEPSDSALTEHLNHSSTCAWATCLSVERQPDEEPETRDPMGDELRNARKRTFTAGPEGGAGLGWPHEGKRGWKCKVDKMVAAGWCFDPAQEAEDGVTCFYCNCSLDGWEPKDDPYQEHLQRARDCRFFQLLDQHQSSASAPVKSKAKAAARGRASSASRTSRVSSATSVMSEATSVSVTDAIDRDLDLEKEGDGTASLDDSVMTTGTVTSLAGGSKTKKGGRTKATTKGAKGRKKAVTTVDSSELEVEYPQLPEQVPQLEEQSQATAGKPVRKRAPRGSKQAESSILDSSTMSEMPTKKPARGKKPRAQAQIAPEHESDLLDNIDVSVSAQLQEELERSISNEQQAEVIMEAPKKLTKPAKDKRGVKRTSDGIAKEQGQSQDSSVVTVEFPMPPKPKAKRGRPRKSDDSSNLESSMIVSLNIGDAGSDKTQSQRMAESQDSAAAEPTLPLKKTRGRPKKSSLASVTSQGQGEIAKAKRAPATKKRGARNTRTASARSSRATDTIETSRANEDDQVEDLDQDEREIEAELERIAAEEADARSMPRASQPDVEDVGPDEKPEEWEPTPSHRLSKHAPMEVAPSSPWQEAETSTPRMQQQPSANAGFVKHATPSPANSDKENQPSSLSNPPATAMKLLSAAGVPALSPSKQVRIPLAPSTPNARTSPSKTAFALSPSKQFSGLTSTAPWKAIDLDSVLLTSTDPSPGKVGVALAQVAGKLTEREQAMTVEEWIKWRAEEGERELRRRCEEHVAVFEKEGLRAMAALEGIEVVG